MSKRGLVCTAVVGLAGIPVLLLGWWLRTPNHRINEETWALIGRGMSEHEVVERLGRPPGSYTSRPLGAEAIARLRDVREACALQFQVTERASEPVPLVPKEWLLDDRAFFVFFDENGRVYNSSFFYYHQQIPFTDQVSEWVGWWW